MNNQGNAPVPADGAEQVSQRAIESPYIPQKGEKYIDVFIGLSKGLSMFEIEAIANKKGLSMKMYDNPEMYKSKFAGNEQDFNAIYDYANKTFAEYKKGNFDKTASNLGIMPDYEFFKNRGGFQYSSQTNVGGPKSGIRALHGFVELLTDEGVAQMNDIVVDSDTGIIMSIEEARKMDKALIVRQDPKNSYGDFYLEAVDYDKDLSKEQILSTFGASSYKTTNPFISFGKGAWAATIPAIMKSVGYIVDKSVDLYELAYDGEVDKDGATDRFGNKWSNYSRTITQKNEDEKQGAFDNWQSFMYAFGDGITQLATMRGVAGFGFYGLQMFGTNAVRAQKIGSAMGMFHASASAASSIDEEMAKMGWSDEMRASFAVPLMGMVFASEKMIGANNLTKFLQSEEKILAKEIREMSTEFAKNTGKKIATADNATKKRVFQDLILKSGARLQEYAEKHGGLAAGMAVGFREEALEEGAEAVMEYGIKKLGDWWMKEAAAKTLEHYTGASFDHETSTIRYASGTTEKLSEEEFEAALKDYEQARGVIERGEGIFNETLSDLGSNVVESAAMGGIVGGLAVPLFNRQAYKKQKEKNKVLYTNAIKMAIDPKHEGAVKEWLKDMVSKNELGRTDIGMDNQPASATNPSQAEVYAESIFNEMKINADLARQYGINDAAVLRANAGDVNMLAELFELTKKKESLNQELAAIDESDLLQEEKDTKKAQIQARIDKTTESIAEYKKPENKTFSKAYNDRLKELHTSHNLTAEMVDQSVSIAAQKGVRLIEATIAEKREHIKKLSASVAGIMSLNEDVLTPEQKKQLKGTQKEIGKISSEIESLISKQIKASEKGQKLIDGFKEDKDKYWNAYTKHALNQGRYSEYRTFAQDGGGLDVLIQRVNEVRKDIAEKAEKVNSHLSGHIATLENAIGKLSSNEDWKSGKNIHINQDVRGLLKEIGDVFQSINSMKMDGADSNTKELVGKLNSILGNDFFSNLQNITNGMSGNYWAEAMMEQESLDFSSINKDSSQISVGDLRTVLSENQISDDFTKEFAQKVVDNSQDDQAMLFDTANALMQDELAQNKFAQNELNWVGTGIDAMGKLNVLSNQDTEGTSLISKESIQSADEWFEVYVQDILDSIIKIQQVEDIADPNIVLGEIDAIVEKITDRASHVLVQGISLSKLNENEKTKDHLTPKEDLPMDNKTYKQVYNSLMGLLEEGGAISALKAKMDELAGNRSLYQKKAQAKHLEFQRLSLIHILERTGSELGKDFQDAVGIIEKIKWNSDSIQDIQASIESNEGRILAAREILFQKRNQLLENKNDALKNIFFKNDEFLFLKTSGMLPFSRVTDENSVDFMNDSFIPKDSITDSDKVGYVYMFGFLEETLNVSPTAAYQAEKALLDEDTGTENKVLSNEQNVATKQLTAFLNNGQSIIGKQLFGLIEDHYKSKNKGAYEAIQKDNEKFLFGSIFLRGYAGVGKTNVMLPFALRMHMRISGKKNLKIKIVDPTNDLKQRLGELSASLKNGETIEIEVVDRAHALSNSINDEHDILVWDEASLLDDGHLNHIQNNLNKKPIIFLGDESQMQSINETSRVSVASRRSMRTTPVTFSFRSNVFQIHQLREAFRKSIIKSKDAVNYPLLFKKKVDKELWGGEYFSDKNKIAEAFLRSESTDKALVFLTEADAKAFYDQNSKDWSQYKGKVYVLESNLSGNNLVLDGDTIHSMQGRAANEVYLHVDFEKLDGIGNDTLRGRAGLTGVTRARHYVALVGDENLNASTQEQVSWNESAITGKTSEDLKRENEELSANRKERLDYLNKLLENRKVSTTTSQSEASQPKVENATTLSKEESDDLRRIAIWELGGIKPESDDKVLAEKYPKEYKKIFEEEKAKKEGKSPEAATKKNFIAKTPPVRLQVKDGNGVTQDVELSVGDSLYDLNGVHHVISSINDSGGKITIGLNGSKSRSFKSIEFSSLGQFFTLPAITTEDKLEGRMHNTSAINFSNYDAIWSSSASIPVSENSKLTPAQVEMLRGAKYEFFANNPGLQLELVYHRSKMLWDDKKKGGRSFSHVMAVQAKGSSLDKTIKSAKPGTLIKKAVDELGIDVVTEALSFIGTFGDIQYDYFKSVSLPVDLKANNFEGIRQQIENGFNSPNPDQNRQENINLNLAKLKMLAMAIQKNESTVTVGELYPNLNTMIDNHVTYDFKGSGMPYSDFVSQESNKGIVFDTKPVVISIINKDGVEQKAYGYRWGRKGSSTLSGEVIVTMPSFKQMKADNISAGEYLQLINKEFESLRQLKKDDNFFKELNKTTLMRTLNSNRKTIERLLADKSSKTKIGDYLEIGKKGFIEFKGKNDAERLDSVKKFVNELDNFFNDKGIIDKTLSNFWIPFSENLSNYLRTKAEFISQPQLFPIPEFKIDELPSASTPTPNNPVPQSGLKRPGKKGLLRTETSDSQKEPYVTTEKAYEIYENIFGEEYAQKALEFESDLGKKGRFRILGQMVNGKTKLLLEEKGIRIKTPKHEALHVVFNYMTNPEKQKQLLDYAKKKVALRDGITEDKVTDLAAEEWMADTYGFTSLDKIKKGKRTIFDKFVDWVADFAHRAGLFKNEMDYLFWQIDRGQFRNRHIDFNREIERNSVEDFDESDIDSDSGPKKQFNMQFLIERFGDVQTVDRAATVLGTYIVENSPLGEDAEDGINSFEDSIRKIKNHFSEQHYTGKEFLSDGRRLEDIKPKDIMRIMNENIDDAYMVLEYMYQNEEIFNAIIEKILPGIDLNSLEVHKEGEDTISDDKSLADFRKKTNAYIRFVLMRTPVYQYKKSGNGFVRVSDEPLGMVDYNDLQFSIIKALKNIKTGSYNYQSDPAEALKQEFLKTAKKIGINTKRGIAMMSFVDAFFGINPKSNSISQKLEKAFRDGNKERQKFISEFMNGMFSQFLSLREKTAVDFSVFGYSKDDMTVKRLEFSGSDSSRYKNAIKASVQSITTDSSDRVKDKVIEKLEKDFVIDESGIKVKSNGEYIIKHHSGSGISSKYTFTNNPKLKTNVRILMNTLGLKSFNGVAFDYVMKDVTAEDYDMDTYFKGLIGQKLDNRAAQFSLKEFFADSIIKMAFAAKHNKEFFKAVSEKLKKITPADYEGENILKDMGLDADKFYADIAKSLFAFDVLDSGLRNVDAVQSQEQDDNDSDTTPYKVFKPVDFYKFFEVLAEVKDFTSGSAGISFFYRPDGKKEYVYGLSSNIFEKFTNGVDHIIQRVGWEPENRRSDSLLYELSSNGEPEFKNMLLKKDGVKLLGLHEIKGIKHGALKKGTTNPNFGNYLTVGLNEFLSSVASGETKSRMSFLTTNLGDSGHMYAATYEFSGRESFLRGTYGTNMKGAKVNHDSLNKAMASVFEGIVREYNVSNQRWDEVLSKIFPGKEIYSKDAKGHVKHAQINKYINQLKDGEYQQFEKMILASKLVMNFDYQFQNGRLQLGKATTGLLDPLTGNPKTSVYNIKDAQEFLSLSGEQATAKRRELLKDSYLEYVRMLNANTVMVSKGYQLPDSFSKDKMYAFQKGSEEWNPILEAQFTGFHITNASLNALWLGSFSQYAGYSTTDQSKRSKPFTTPGTTAGKINVEKDPYGMDVSMKIAVISDLNLTGSQYEESVYKNTETDPITATDGIGWANPLAYRFIDHSFGGRFGVLDKGMRKPITSYVDPHTGMAIQLKQAEHPITHDVYSNSLTARRMMNEFLSITHPSLPALFSNWYNNAGGGKAGWDIAMDNAVDFVINGQLHKNLVWQFIHLSAVKTGAHSINAYNLDTGFENPNNVQTIDIDTREIRSVLNPYQDFNDNERMAPPTQMLAIMGIGQQNKKRIRNVNNAMKLIFTKGVGNILNDLFAKGETGLRELMLKAADGMGAMGDFAELVANNKISLDLPMLSEKLQQIVANNATKNGQKTKFPGLRANQAPGYILDVYEMNGKIYMLSELERMGYATVNPDLTITIKEGVTVTKRKLHPMTNGKPAEIIVPFIYMQKFGVRPDETLNDIYQITLIDGKKADVRDMGTQQLKAFIKANFDKIDIEATPMMRALRQLSISEEIKAKKESEEEVQNVGNLGEIMKGNKKLLELRQKLKQAPFDKKAFILSKVGDYFNALEQSLNLFGVRIPTSNIGSGFHGRIVGFINDNGNTVYTSELKNVIDGSDYDIDQLSLFTRFIDDDFKLPKENSVKGLQNYVVNELMNIYSDARNNSDIYVKLSLKRLKRLADDIEEKVERYINDPGTAANDYFTNIQGADSIDRFANLSSAFSYLNHLTENEIRQMIPWAHNSIFKSGRSEYSPIYMLGTYLNAATDNAKELILGRLGISKDATNVVGAMIVSGKIQEEIADFFDNKYIRSIYMQAQNGYGVESSRFEHLPYLLTTKRINVLLKNGILNLNAAQIKNDYETARSLVTRNIIDNGFATKGKSGKYEVFDEKKYSESIPEGAALIEIRNKLYNQLSEINEYAKLTELKDYLEKGEALRRISYVVTLRKGFKAVSSDFEFYKNTLEEFLGMEVYKFADGDAWTPEKHMSFFVTRNNDARFGDYDHKMAAMEMEEALLKQRFSLAGIVRALPQFDEYIKRLRQLDDFYNQQILFRSREIQGWTREYLAGQERTTWLSSGQRQTFYNELGKFFLAVHFKNHYKGIRFNLGLSLEGIGPNSILNDVRIDTPEGRTMFALQFPQFVMAMKAASSDSDLAVQGNDNYKEWFNTIKTNQFIERLTITGNNDERGFLALQDSYNLDPSSIYKLKSEFNKLPQQLQEMFEVYEMIVNGFEDHNGSIKNVMGHKVLEGVSETFNNIKEMIKNKDRKIQTWKANFLKALPHAQGMSRYYSLKDSQNHTEREVVEYSNPNGHRSMFQSKIKARLISRKPSEYAYEYLRTSKLGIPYDPDKDVTTTFEPIHGLSANEMDTLLSGGTLTKEFLHGHSYTKTTTLKKGGEEVKNYYILPNGKYVYVASSSQYSVTFKATDDVPESAGRTVDTVKHTFNLENAGNRLYSYHGTLNVKDVEEGANENIVFIKDGFLYNMRDNKMKRDTISAMENTVVIPFKNMRSKHQQSRHIQDGPNGQVNKSFKEAVDKQIQILKKHYQDGKSIAFPKFGVSEFNEIKQSASIQYLINALKDNFGIVFETQDKLTQQEKSNLTAQRFIEEFESRNAESVFEIAAKDVSDENKDSENHDALTNCIPG